MRPFMVAREFTKLSKAEQIAEAMYNSTKLPAQSVESLTGVKKTSLERLSKPLVAINRTLITAMLAEAYDMAETANEVVNVAKELGKLHGLYEPEKTVTLNVKGDISKQLSRMTNEELVSLMNADPDTILLEGECSTADDEDDYEDFTDTKDTNE
jgi:hypothetical protein